MKNLLFSCCLSLFVLLIVQPASAQKTAQTQKNVMKVVRSMNTEGQANVIKMADGMIEDKAGAGNITDLKSLKRYFGMLNAEAQMRLSDYAEALASGKDIAAAPPAPEPPKVNVPMAPPAPQAQPQAQPAPAPGNQTIMQAPVNLPDYMLRAQNMPQTGVTWAEDNFSFGEIKQGDVARHVFKFKNTGSEPLQLTQVRASCGCTTPRWTNAPIPPGGEGEIEVAFNSAGRSGIQAKSVTVTGNFEGNTKILRFDGNVVMPAPSAQPANNTGGGKR